VITRTRSARPGRVAARPIRAADRTVPAPPGRSQAMRASRPQPTRAPVRLATIRATIAAGLAQLDLEAPPPTQVVASSLITAPAQGAIHRPEVAVVPRQAAPAVAITGAAIIAVAITAVAITAATATAATATAAVVNS